MARDDRPAEQPAVKTTIVGGRPPGPGKGLGPIPRGIEVLIKKAAVDPAFKRLLLETRDEAAGEIDLALDPAEAMMLRAAPRGELEAIIARTRVHPNVRSAFLGRAAAVMLVALGAGAVGCEEDGEPAGVDPDRPPAVERVEPPEAEEAGEEAPPEAEPVPRVVTGIQPARTPRTEQPLERPERVEPSDGSRPARPPQAPPKPEAESAVPAPKPSPPAPTGIRPDRPPEAGLPEAGAQEPPAAPRATAARPITSTTTSDAVTRGVRPDRPQPKPPSGATTTAEKPASGSARPPKPIVSRTFPLPATWSRGEVYDHLAVGLKRLADAHLPGAKFIYSANDDGQKYIRIEYKPTKEKVQKTDEATGETQVVTKAAPEDDGLLLTVWMNRRLIEADRPRVMGYQGERRWWKRIDQVFVVPHQTYLKWNLHYGTKTDRDAMARFMDPGHWVTVPDPALATKAHPVNVSAVPSFGATAKHQKPEGRTSFTATAGIGPDRPWGGTFGIMPDRPPQTKGIRPDRPKSEEP
ncbi:MAG: hypothetical protein R6X20_03535 [Phycisphaerae bacterium]